MTYSEILSHIFQSFPMYHRIGAVAYKEGLENIEQLAVMAGHPERKIKTIHIAGTNGKGSVAHLLSSYFQELGLKTGLFTSPHLIDFRERIKINGKEISEQKVIDFFEKHQESMAKIEPSFFEMTTILAFDTFVNECVDIAIIETGLGGRLDATNILSPILSIITNISFDHTKMLGNTLHEIAFEKAGIIKENVPVVIGEYHPETFPVFERIALQKSAPLFLAKEYVGVLEFGSPYQRKNLGTVIKCLEVIGSEGYLYSLRLIKRAIQNLYKNTGFMGRWQIVSEMPLTICDAAHNPAGIAIAMEQLQQLHHRNLHIIMGFVNDKDIAGIIPLLQKKATYYPCQANIERALPADELYQQLESAKLRVKIARGNPTVLNVYNQVAKTVLHDDIIFIGGSFFVVGEFLKNYKK